MKKHLTRLLNLMALAVLVVALSSCASKLNDDNLAKVKNGMTSAEVKKILGGPDRVETGNILGLEGTTFYYHRGESKVQISFINDQVSVKLGTFGETR